MNKYLILFLGILMLPAAALFAQSDNLDLFKQIDDPDKTATPTPAPEQTSGTEQPPTIITASKESTFDGKEKVAVLFGDVKVKNPQFTLNSDKLTVYFHKDTDGGKQDPTPKKHQEATPVPAPIPGAPDPGSTEGGGIEKVIAEGSVVINSDRPDPKGGPAVHYAGKGDKVVYTPATGEMILSGMPQLQNGKDILVATDSSTVIYLYRDGNMHAEGPHEMTIYDPGPDKATPSPAPATTPEVK